MLAMPDFDFLGILMAFGGAGLLFVLASGMVITFFIINRRLRTSATLSPETKSMINMSIEVSDDEVR